MFSITVAVVTMWVRLVYGQEVQTGDCTTMTAFPPDRSSGCCGVPAGLGKKRSAGVETAIHDHPWTVLIEYLNKKNGRTETYCGGSLISSKHVLTAAYCTGANPKLKYLPTVVRLGEYNTTNEGMDCVMARGGGQDCTDGVIRIAIEKVIPHSMFSREKSHLNDIALIRLKETAPYTDFIRPVCLPTKDLKRPENTPFSMYAIGWGATASSKQSYIKQHVKLPFVSHEKCKSIFGGAPPNVALGQGQLCAGGIEGMDTCNGDGGGPLVHENQGIFELTGIISLGLAPCGQKDIPSVYTNVYEYLDWIKTGIVS